MIYPFQLLLVALLRMHLRGCRTILDVGCGTGSLVRYVRGYKVGVEAHQPTLEKARELRTHDDFLQFDVTNLGTVKSGSYDAVVGLDIIEHLTFEEGTKLLAEMERIASRRVVILTPNGFVPQLPSTNPFWQHKSGWLPEDFRSRGYHVRGFLGLKWFLGSEARPQHCPRVLASLLGLLTVPTTYFLPSAAFSVFAWKDR